MYVPDAARLRISDPERRKMNGLQSDCIAEVTPSGAVVWDWKSHDHLDLDGWCRNDPSSNWIHFNHIQPLPENRWYDAGDLRFKPGNILVSGRSLGFIFIIEKETGEIVWRYYGDYNGGLSGQHSPLMIGKGYPGEGNILVYDNGQSPLRQDMHGGRTYILEINPSSSGIVWAYSGGDGYYRPYRFFSPYGGHCVRLPNGNTLATETMSNRAFEVTMEGEIVWEHVGNPDNIELTMCARRIPYDACPQLAALPKPRETEVVPPAHAILKPKNPIQRTE